MISGKIDRRSEIIAALYGNLRLAVLGHCGIIDRSGVPNLQECFKADYVFILIEELYIAYHKMLRKRGRVSMQSLARGLGLKHRNGIYVRMKRLGITNRDLESAESLEDLYARSTIISSVVDCFENAK